MPLKFESFHSPASETSEVSDLYLFANIFRRIIWLGDLNYRINMSYDRAHELIYRKEWSKLFEKDQVSDLMLLVILLFPCVF